MPVGIANDQMLGWAEVQTPFLPSHCIQGRIGDGSPKAFFRASSDSTTLCISCDGDDSFFIHVDVRSLLQMKEMENGSCVPSSVLQGRVGGAHLPSGRLMRSEKGWTLRFTCGDVPSFWCDVTICVADKEADRRDERDEEEEAEEAEEAEDAEEAEKETGDQGRSDGDLSAVRMDEDEYGIPAGGCWAIALQKAGVFPKLKDAVLALDQTAISEGDFSLACYTPGDAWSRRAVDLTLEKEGLCLDPVPVSELDQENTFIVTGVANDSFLSGKEWVSIFQRDDENDNPRDDPANWQHVMAVKKGAMHSKYIRISTKWLHLLDGKADPEKGFFRSIDAVYKLKPLPNVQRGVKRSIRDVDGRSRGDAM